VGKLAVVGVVSQSGSLEAVLIGSVAMFVGGVGSIAGAVLGGIVLATMQTLAAGYISGTWSDVIVYGMLLAVILLRPAGLLGSRRIGSLD
jgi:branched-chain amino acid transport system permease protein